MNLGLVCLKPGAIFAPGFLLYKDRILCRLQALKGIKVISGF